MPDEIRLKTQGKISIEQTKKQTMAINNTQVNFTREQLIVHKHKRNSFFYLIYAILRLIGIVIENIYCVSSYLILSWILLLPIKWIKRDLYSKLENYLYNSLLYIVSSWSLAAESLVVEAGDDFKSLIEETQQTVIKPLPDSKENGINLPSAHYIDSSTSTIDNPASVTKKSYKIYSDINSLTQTNNQADIVTQTANDNLTQNIEDASSNLLKTSINGDGYLVVENQLNGINGEHSNQDHLTNVNVKKTTNYTNSSHDRLSGDGDIANGSNAKSSPLLDPQDSTAKPRVLLLCNHISTADVPLIMQSFSTLTKQSLLWVLDAQVGTST